MTPTVSIIVPTVDGRETYLDMCLRGYTERTENARLQIIVIKNRPTCGIAWRAGLEKATGEYVHLTADDMVPGYGWLPPMIEAVEAGAVPCGLCVRPTLDVVGTDGMPLSGNPASDSYFFADEQSGLGEVEDWQETRGRMEYPCIPFCSRDQWDRIGPMIASQYGGDKWFGWRANRAGIRCVARTESRFYHYLARAGRDPVEDGWYWLDRVNFDFAVALPLYMAGALDAGELHPEWNTPLGLRIVRAWHELTIEAPYHWEPGGPPGSP